MTLVLERWHHMGIIESAQERDFGCKSLASSSKHHDCQSISDMSLRKKIFKKVNETNYLKKHNYENNFRCVVMGRINSGFQNNLNIGLFYLTEIVLEKYSVLPFLPLFSTRTANHLIQSRFYLPKSPFPVVPLLFISFRLFLFFFLPTSLA